mgnify:CR=1 FL=1
MHLPLLLKMLEKQLNGLSSQVETVLVYLQGIFDFLGIAKTADQPVISSQGHEGKPQHGESNIYPAVIPASEVLSDEASSGNRYPGLSDPTRVRAGSEHTAMKRTFVTVVKNGTNTLQNVVLEAVNINNREQERRAGSFIVSGLKHSLIANETGRFEIC